MAGHIRAVVYSRVSTDAQERDGTSLDTQERACEEHVSANGWVLVESIRDTASGSSLDRPGTGPSVPWKSSWKSQSVSIFLQ